MTISKLKKLFKQTQNDDSAYFALKFADYADKVTDSEGNSYEGVSDFFHRAKAKAASLTVTFSASKVGSVTVSGEHVVEKFLSEAGELNAKIECEEGIA